MDSECRRERILQFFAVECIGLALREKVNGVLVRLRASHPNFFILNFRYGLWQRSQAVQRPLPERESYAY